MRCGWCETSNVSGRDHCVNCGGPLPVPAGADPGPAPPDVPRVLPDVFVRRVSYARNAGLRFGVAFGAIGALTSVGFVIGTVVFPPMVGGLCIGLIFVFVGAGIAVSGWRGGQARLEVLRSGVAAVGRVEAVREASSDGAGRPCWRLTYGFEADGRAHRGSVISSDAEITRFASGHPVHVVYRPEDPAQSDIWPLLA